MIPDKLSWLTFANQSCCQKKHNIFFLVIGVAADLSFDNAQGMTFDTLKVTGELVSCFLAYLNKKTLQAKWQTMEGIR
jgi:hypothetical protein